MPTQSKFARQAASHGRENENINSVEYESDAQVATAQLRTSNRARRATEKQSLRLAEAEAAAERRMIKAKKRQLEEEAQNESDIGDIDADEGSIGDNQVVDYSFTDRTVASKPSQLKILAQRNNRIPSTRKNHTSSSGDRAHVVHRGCAIERSLQQQERSWAPASSDFDEDGLPPDFEEDRLPVNYDAQHSPTLSQADSNHQSDSGHKRQRSRSNSPLGTLFAKAQKINDNSGRPKTSDYNDITQEIITTAISVFRCKICTTAPFPDRSTELELVQDAWKEGYVRNSLPPMELTPTLAKLIMTRVSHVRGKLKTKVRPLVEIIYGFESGQGAKAIARNRQRAEDLQEGYNFVYKVTNTDKTLRKGLYQNKIIQKTINAMWFSNRKDEGVRFQEFFDPFPVVCIALVLTAIQCGIDEWATGIRTDVQFTAADYHTVFEEHLKCLESYDKHTHSHRLLDSLCFRLHNDGRVHAGAQSTGIERSMALSADAFAAAIKEFENATTEDSDAE